LNNYYNLEILSYKFSKEGEGFSNLTDEEFKHNVALAKKHCFRGDVFQLVLSRRFTQGFKGDEFNVYRVEKHQPFPYLFFWLWGFQNIWFFTWSTNYCKRPKPKSILLQELLKEQVMMKRRNTSQRIIRR
jgi:anthranilate/para-aminobenzoate synthase component I